MRLPLSLVLHAMTSLLEHGHEQYAEDDRLLARPVFERRREDGQSRIVLVSGLNEQGIQDNILKEDVVFTYPLFKGAHFPCPAFAVKQGVSLTEVSDSVHRLFDYYEAWIENLYALMERDAVLEEYLNISETVLKNPVSVMGRNYYMVAISQKTRQFIQEGKLPPMKQGTVLPMEIINDFKNDAHFLAAAEKKEYFYYYDQIRGERELCQNLFANELVCARVIMSETESPFMPWTPYLFEILIDRLSSVYSSSGDVPEEIIRSEELYARAIFHGEFSQENAQELRQLNNWEQQDSFVVIKISLGNKETGEQTFAYYRLMLAHEFENCVIAADPTSIYILARDGEQALAQNQGFLQFVREANFRLGVSNTMDTLNDLLYYIRQAEIALEYGQKDDTTIWIHMFDSYAFPYLLDTGTTEMPLRLLQAREVRLLKEYDRTHNANLTETLKVYLQSGYNASITAQKLYIQRRTLYFRMERIKRITQLQFDNTKRMAHIILSFSMNE